MSDSKSKFLIIEDDDTVRDSIVAYFEDNEFEVVEAENGKIGLELFEEQKPDIVITDLRMPVVNGLEVISTVKKIAPDIPIIVVSGTGNIIDAIDAVRLGAWDYVTKPIHDLTVLELATGKALERAKLIKDNKLYQNQLEEQVKERTTELQKTNIQLEKEIEVRQKAEDVLNQYTIKLESYAIDLKKHIEELNSAHKQLDLAAKVFESTNEGIMVTDAESVIQSVNPAFTTITGYSIEEAAGNKPKMLKSGQQDQKFYEEMWKKLLNDGNWKGEIWNRRKNGEIYPQWLTINTIKDENDNTTHYVAVFSDITKIKRSEQRLNYLAYHDSLTGLANRLLFHDRLQQAIWQAKRNEDILAVLYLDLDRFKIINDTLGHSIGDRVLRQVAERLKKCVRESDTVSRWGGDEFTIIMQNIKLVQDVGKIAKAILGSLSQAFRHEGYELYIRASLGISMYPNDGDEVDDILKKADTAMYQAKLHGKNNYKFFSQSMNVASVERLTLETSLRRAIENEEFQLNFQPKVSLSNGKIVGMEALLYWQDPKQDIIISPGQFIPLAEETGLILPIGEWVIRKACLQNKQWQDEGLCSIPIAVNLSTRQFQQKNLLDVIDQALNDTKLEPRYLELEITESILMDDVEEAIFILKEFKNRGIKISIDDFGTGYSSLNYLKRFPIDKLKIDQSFVRDITVDPDDASITKAVIALGHNMHLEVIAEGVETKDQLIFLYEHQCNEAQGYYFSRPISACKFCEFLKKNVVFDDDNILTYDKKEK